MKAIAIYKVTNRVNGKMYIGQTIHPERRFVEHARGGSKCYILSAAVRKYGKENFDFNVLCWCPDKPYANMVEKGLIAAYDTRKNGYNICVGGEGLGSGVDNPWFGGKHTQEAKDALRAAKLGAKNPMYGKQNTPQQIAKIRASLIGRDITWGDKISAAKKGVRAANCRLAPIVCKKGDELYLYESIKEAAEKLGVCKAIIHKWIDGDTKNKAGIVIRRAAPGDNPFSSLEGLEYKAPKKGSSKSVVCRKDGVELVFDSVVEAAKHINVNPSSISRWLKGKHASSFGWVVSEHSNGD